MDVFKELNMGLYCCMSLLMDFGWCDSWDGVVEFRFLMFY